MEFPGSIALKNKGTNKLVQPRSSIIRPIRNKKVLIVRIFHVKCTIKIAWVAGDDAPAGRPFPWMCYLNAMKLGVYSLESVVKIGDTLADIEEGFNAGIWTVGLSLSGNLLGLIEAEFDHLGAEEISRRRATIEERLYQAGAHYVVDSMWDCKQALLEIQARLIRREKPWILKSN